jgi:hypothetical protein
LARPFVRPKDVEIEGPPGGPLISGDFKWSTGWPELVCVTKIREPGQSTALMPSKAESPTRAVDRAQAALRCLCWPGSWAAEKLGNSQPTNNQCYGVTKREHTASNALLITRFFAVFRQTLAAHNGLIGGFAHRTSFAPETTVTKTRDNV